MSRILFFACLGMLRVCCVSLVHGLDLTHAVVVLPEGAVPLERKAVSLLVEEIAKRAQVTLPVRSSLPSGGTPYILAGRLAILSTLDGVSIQAPHTPTAEGFRVSIVGTPGAGSIHVIGNDARGVLYGVGHVLRQMQLQRGRIEVPESASISTAPRCPLRGHQLGYRPKTHSYDAWDLVTWEQYYRDLVVFGANAVELVPPRTDDDADSPHFPMPPLAMMTGMSRLADDYGLDVWIWFPAMDKDYSNSETVAAALKEWDEVYRALPRIDAIFVPGGDPGHTRPKHLMALLEKQTESLHRRHPKAQMWVSPQSFNAEWLAEFIEILDKERPRWLSGIVFGPQVRISLPELRAAVPREYPIRNYPDITHTRQCQYPVPDWDTAFAVTEGRECINPRPLDQAAIVRLLQPYTIGFISYSEGCNDDVNKAVWSALNWDPDRDVSQVLREYARYYMGAEHSEGMPQGLLALERNWRGPLAANEGVDVTLQQFQDMERRASPALKANWRFQQALFRAYYDAYTRRRLLNETLLESRALAALREAAGVGTSAAMRHAEEILALAATQPVATDVRGRIFELAEGLFQSIRMQLSVPRYQAIGVDRGASLDTVDYPLNNRRWLLEQFEKIRRLPGESTRLKALEAVAGWTDPGPGGFYDDTGNAALQPHVVRGLSFAEDPASLRSSKIGFEEGDVVDEPDEKPEGALRYSWLNHAESLIDQPLRMRYTGLDRAGSYRLRVLYAGDAPKIPIRLVANGGNEIHPLIAKPFPFQPLEFDLPASVTAGGVLELEWNRPAGLAGNGRGCQVSEVWLLRR